MEQCTETGALHFYIGNSQSNLKLDHIRLRVECFAEFNYSLWPTSTFNAIFNRFICNVYKLNRSYNVKNINWWVLTEVYSFGFWSCAFGCSRAFKQTSCLDRKWWVVAIVRASHSKQYLSVVSVLITRNKLNVGRCSGVNMRKVHIIASKLISVLFMYIPLNWFKFQIQMPCIDLKISFIESLNL